jgi:hypothetical protein
VGLGSVFAALSLLGLAFQNCAPPPLPTANETENASLTPGDTAFRLPTDSGSQSTSGTAVSCSLSTNMTSVAVNATVRTTVTATGTVPTGSRVVWFGTKRLAGTGFDVTVTDEAGDLVTSTFVNDFPNGGKQAGTYTRWVQVRDPNGRTLCQTNSVSVTFQGQGCILQTPYPRVRAGQMFTFNIYYATTDGNPPTGAKLFWNGSTNGITVAEHPYGQTNLKKWEGLTAPKDIATYIRNLRILNADDSEFCRTNNVKYFIDP